MGPDWLGTKMCQTKMRACPISLNCALASNQLAAQILAATFSTQLSATFTQILVEFFWQGTFGSQPIRLMVWLVCTMQESLYIWIT
jgi:hypothetical protein